MTKALRHSFLIAGILIGVLIATTGVASAHASVLSTNPADLSTQPDSPAEVSVIFSETVSVNAGGLTVRNRDGVRVDENNNQVVDGTILRTQLQPNLADGTYIATYRVLSADGHPVSGSFIFGIGLDSVDFSATSSNTGDRPWEIFGSLARFLLYLAALSAAGMAFFLGFIHDQASDRWKLIPVVRIGSILAFFGAFGVVMAQAALLTGRGATAVTDTTVLRDVLSQSLGWSLVLLFVGLAAVHLSTDIQQFSIARPLALYGGLAVTISFALWGHASELRPVAISVTADAVHATAAALWLGGVIGLAMVLGRRTATQLDGSVAIVRRFSTMAMGSVIALVLAGVMLTLTGTNLSWHALLSTTWGRLVLLKIVLTMSIVALAAWNRRSLLPRLLEPTEDGDSDPRSHQWNLLRRTVRIEVFVIVAILAFTAILANITPARTAVGTTSNFSANQTVSTGSVQLLVGPAKIGVNSVHVQYLDKSNQAIDSALTLTIEFSLPSVDLPPISRQVVKIGPGHFVQQGPEFSLAGTWTVTLVIRTGDFSEQRTSFEVPIQR